MPVEQAGSPFTNGVCRRRLDSTLMSGLFPLRALLIFAAIAATITAMGDQSGRASTGDPILPQAAPSTPILASSIQFIVDNDYAVYAGNATNVTRVIHQNNVVWMQQLVEAKTIDLDLQAGETHVYLIALDGGGSADAGGRINGADITTIATAERAYDVNGPRGYLDISSGLTDGSTTNGNFGDTFANSSSEVSDGSFSVILGELQTALTGANWQVMPTPPAAPFQTSSPVACSNSSPTPGRCWDTPISGGGAIRFPAVDIPVAPTAPGNEEASLTWYAPTSDGGSPITGYTIEKSDDNGVTWTSTTTSPCSPASATCSIITGLTNETTYVFRVKASNADGDSGWSSNSRPVTPTGTVPDPPTNVAATEADGRATVTWSAPAYDGGGTITGYVLEQSSDGGTTWTTPTTGTCTPATTTCATVDGLAGGATYTYRLRARNAYGQSANSTTASVTTPTDPEPQPKTPAPQTSPTVDPALQVLSSKATGKYRITTRVRVPSAGTIVLNSSRARTAARRSIVCRVARRDATKAGVIRIVCRLNAATRRTLSTRAVRVRVGIIFTDANGTTQRRTRVVVLPRVELSATPTAVTG